MAEPVILFPASADSDSTLFLAKNNTYDSLSAGINDSITTITVYSTTGFPTSGYISIELEVIHYTGLTPTTFTGCTRGADGSTNLAHLVDVAVVLRAVARHHNALKDAVIALETYAFALLPATIASVLTDHNKANHDALNIDADTLDGLNSGNAAGNIPVSNGTVNTNLNADKVDGVNLPGSLASVLSDHNKSNHDVLAINADTVDGWHRTSLVARGNHSGTQPISTLSDHNKANHDSLSINAGQVGGFSADDLIAILS
ncbi:MAG TPA: hypothetical protein ENI23_08165 [bacterium]|nr:hypothetical protein [bacterium]